MSDVQNHGERAHSLLSASGSSRWMNCTPSARKEEPIPNLPSPYAEEGTLAHELAEIELKKHFGIITREEFIERFGVIQDNELYSDDMPEFVDDYVSYCIEQVNHYKSTYKFVEISIEEKIDLTAYIPEGFGSNDFVIIADGLIDGSSELPSGIIEVIDLKYGRGVSVSAVDNPQLKLYGLGSVFKHRLSYNMKDIKLTVVQPRTFSVSSFIIDVHELEEWANTEVVTKAKIAFEGGGELKTGEWCKFCRFKPKCRAVYNNNQKLMQKDFGDPDELTEEEIKSVFEKADQITSWVTAVNAYVLDKLLKKEEFNGYKLVKGRSTRKFKDPKAVYNELTAKGYKPEDLMSEPKLLGITAIEKLVGKKNFEAELSAHIFKTEPKPSIAPISDKRDSFFSSAENDFL